MTMRRWAKSRLISTRLVPEVFAAPGLEEIRFAGGDLPELLREHAASSWNSRGQWRYANVVDRKQETI
jgi:hypothetical protein